MDKDEFKTARTTLGLSQADIAKQLGDGDDHYSVRAVASWENGERKVPPAVAKLTKLMVRAKS